MQSYCDYFGECGGCTLQDQAYEAQLQLKENRLRSLLADVLASGVTEWLPTIKSQPWAYRHRARFSVGHGPPPEDVVIGFHHARRKHEIVGLDHCPIMASPLASLLSRVRACVQTMDMRVAVPQVDMIAAENGRALIFRLRHPLSKQDLERLINFDAMNDVHIFVQEQGPESIQALTGCEPFQPCYRLEEFDLNFLYPVTQFAQVNPAINHKMVHAVIAHLDPQVGERIADLFCGAGNFTLPAARRGAQVTGWEWSQEAVDCATGNAQRNDLQEKATFECDDLERASQEKCQRLAGFDKFILDPPRSGAEAIMNCMPDSGQRRVVYVSCQPKTLARDAAILVHQKGYRLTKAGLIDMFPHTDHIEAMAVFERDVQG